MFDLIVNNFTFVAVFGGLSFSASVGLAIYLLENHNG